MSKIKRKVKSVVKKAAKKNPIVTFIVLILVLAIVGGAYYFLIYKNENPETKPATGEFSIHFFPLGNASAGDSLYIKAGENDILIDAGSTKGSASSIINYVDRYCEDGVLEYVIATHADSDHIAAFTGDNGIFAYYKCQTIIDFPRTNKTTATYNEYVERRDAEVANDGAVHYTALECFNETNGAKQEYKLTESVTMQILYNKYYTEYTSNENNYSVITMFTHGSRNFLLTGDLEEAGEREFVNYYTKPENPSLPKVEFFKAGHHGSATSSNKALLDIIQPNICVISTVAGETSYGFPHQEFLNRIFAVPDCKVYVPAYRDDSGNPQLLNGEIVIISNQTEVKVECSNNNTLFQDTDWFKANRTYQGVA